MKMIFEIPDITLLDDYIQAHDNFISEIIIKMSYEDITEIIYSGNLPYGVETVKLSDFLALHGCMQYNDGYIGYFGYSSYKDTLQRFICETALKYSNTAYKIDVDIKPVIDSCSSKEFAKRVDLLLTE